MKTFKVYKDIRKQAMIMGLPIGLFAIMMTSVLVSLLVIIFSFSLMMILSVIAVNSGLYVILTHLVKQKGVLQINRVFPKAISSKKLSPVYYE
ncbi:hypothetical protein NO995_11065 [Aestuariibaculum sp. M13]|uniref:hypothetical protein n=1 Tax=Aestuariibaculum sp. M13 TaxID=2967132 RepID=UPI002159F2EB|nr:hypothetical protein [Aestuariibaculum sp. M13]MCR8668226.1 hypothetical protein [Aestuariibaculum sp. M13]